MALIISGLPTDRFIFDGFIARSGQERAAHINELALQRRTVILYEAPHRLHRTLVDLSVACGPERQVALCRELTKIHEEVWRGTLGEAVGHYGTNEPQGYTAPLMHHHQPPMTLIVYSLPNLLVEPHRRMPPQQLLLFWAFRKSRLTTALSR